MIPTSGSLFKDVLKHRNKTVSIVKKVSFISTF